MTDTTLPEVRDDRGHNRFVLEVDGHAGELQYLTQPGRLILVHTEVPEELGGRGVGGALGEEKGGKEYGAKEEAGF